MREIRAQVKAELEFPSPPASGDRWRDLLRRRGGEHADKWSLSAESQQEGDLDWCEAMLTATCRSVSEVAALASLDVAAAALGHVINEINPAEVNRVRKRAQSDDPPVPGRGWRPLSTRSVPTTGIWPATRPRCERPPRASLRSGVSVAQACA